jgi:hypothetical protein
MSVCSVLWKIAQNALFVYALYGLYDKGNMAFFGVLLVFYLVYLPSLIGSDRRVQAKIVINDKPTKNEVDEPEEDDEVWQIRYQGDVVWVFQVSSNTAYQIMREDQVLVVRDALGTELSDEDAQVVRERFKALILEQTRQKREAAAKRVIEDLTSGQRGAVSLVVSPDDAKHESALSMMLETMSMEEEEQRKAEERREAETETHSNPYRTRFELDRQLYEIARSYRKREGS